MVFLFVLLPLLSSFVVFLSRGHVLYCLEWLPCLVALLDNQCIKMAENYGYFEGIFCDKNTGYGGRRLCLPPPVHSRKTQVSFRIIIVD